MDVLRSPALHVTPQQANERQNDPGHPSARILSHGSMEVRWYRPEPGEPHHPHDRDEVYCVARGTATFHRDEESGPFVEQKFGTLGELSVQVAPGDVMFVPAGAQHGFDAMSPDFAVWAIFYGPEGGEDP